MNDLTASLSETEIEELREFLMSDDTPDECMDLSTLDGFLTALLIGPDTIQPSQWFPVAFGETEQEPMKWKSPDLADHFMGLILRHYNSIALDFQDDPPDFRPLFMTNTLPDEDVTIIDEWCWGFMQAVEMNSEAWRPLLEDKEHEAAVFPIFLHGTREGWKRLEEDSEIEKVPHEKWVAMIPTSVMEAHQYWLPLRKAEEQVSHTAISQKIGRNALCPCGSGKKYKKCCGNVAEA